MVSPMMVSPLLVQQLRTKYVLCDSDFSSSIWEQQQQQQQQQSTIKNNSNQQPTKNNNPQKSTINNQTPKEIRKKSHIFLFFPMVNKLLIDDSWHMSKPRLKPQVVTFNAMISSCGSYELSWTLRLRFD